MQIGGLQKLTLIDYPGKLACTVFCAGCDFRCPFCYNPDIVLAPGLDNASNMREQEFFDFLKQRKGFLEGVVIGGGEPTIHNDLLSFCEAVKNLGYDVKLDTNGSNPDLLNKLINQELVDYVAMDVKAPKHKYAKVAGLNSQLPFSSNKRDFWISRVVDNIEKSIHILKQNKVEYEFRTTFVRGLLKKQDILSIAKWLKPARKYFIQNFNPQKTLDPKFKKVKPYSQAYLLRIRKAISPFFDTCQIRE